jgi:hypothetical protein
MPTMIFKDMEIGIRLNPCGKARFQFPVSAMNAVEASIHL